MLEDDKCYWKKIEVSEEDYVYGWQDRFKWSTKFPIKKDTHREAQRSWNFRTHTKDKEKSIKASREKNNLIFYD